MRENITYKYIDLTGLTEAQILARGKELLRAMEKRFGKGQGGTLQSCVDACIDGAIERNQGS